MYFVYATNSDCAVGTFASLGAAQSYAQDWAHRHRTTTVTVVQNGSQVYAAPVRPKASTQGT